jgi:hypothetical protein
LQSIISASPPEFICGWVEQKGQTAISKTDLDYTYLTNPNLPVHVNLAVDFDLSMLETIRRFLKYPWHSPCRNEASSP